MSPAAASRDSDAGIVAARRRALLAWYDAHGRALPWRSRPSLYGTWISEIMLQQTTVAAVIPRWEAFLTRFPDVAALAAASETDVLAEWTGLGYYRRARMLHRAARQVVTDGGALPSTLAGWRALPGVGEYTAGAIASIGLGLVEAAVDANVRRVLTRWHCADRAAVERMRPRDLARLASEHLDPERPGDWNQALMDLGAMVCVSDAPACDRCPLAEFCAAGRAGTADQVPPARVRAEAHEVVLGALVVRRGDEVLLMPSAQATVVATPELGPPRRRDLDGLLAQTLCVPLTPWYRPAADAAAALEQAWRNWLAEFAGPDLELRPMGVVRHAITRYRLRIHVYVADMPDRQVTGLPSAAWRRPGGDWPGSTLARRCLDQAQKWRC
jgi:A/G-specific adenine glycosylase